jgi:hypothetical protein
MAIGLILSVIGLGRLLLLLFQATVYALPAFVGFTAGLWAFNTGAGPIGALVVGTVAAAATFAAFLALLGITRRAEVRTLLAILFATPAAYAGYHVVLALAQYGVPSENWRHVFAVLGAGAISYAAVTRLMLRTT